MLGLADRARVVDLFEAVMRGRLPDAMTGLKLLHDSGADPGHVISDLADFVHLVTRLKLVPDAAKDPGLTEDERRRGAAFAADLSLPVLTRAWQLLLKGLADIKDAPRPLAAADMVLVRLACAADLPTPDEALKRLAALPAAASGPALSSAPPSHGPAGTGSPPVAVRRWVTAGRPPRWHCRRKTLRCRCGRPCRPPRPPSAARARVRAADGGAVLRLQSFAEVVALAQARRDIQLKVALERDVRLVRFEDGSIEFELAPDGSPQIAANLMRRLAEWTGTRWMVAVVSGGGAPSLREAAAAAAREEKDGVAADPTVRLLLDTFPGSEIVAVRSLIDPPAPELVAAAVTDALDEEVGYGDAGLGEDRFDDEL